MNGVTAGDVDGGLVGCRRRQIQRAFSKNRAHGADDLNPRDLKMDWRGGQEKNECLR